jgi:hypothetical protein
LQHKGFVVLRRQGEWYGRKASLYATTDRGENDGLPARAWRQWDGRELSEKDYREFTSRSRRRSVEEFDDPG